MGKLSPAERKAVAVVEVDVSVGGALRVEGNHQRQGVLRHRDRAAARPVAADGDVAAAEVHRDAVERDRHGEPLLAAAEPARRDGHGGAVPEAVPGPLGREVELRAGGSRLRGPGHKGSHRSGRQIRGPIEPRAPLPTPINSSPGGRQKGVCCKRNREGSGAAPSSLDAQGCPAQT